MTITFSGGMKITGGGITASGTPGAISWTTATPTISGSYAAASPTQIIYSGSGLNISTSTDGVAWSTTTLPTPSGAQTANQVIYANGQWVIAGNPFTCSWTSTDGTTWTVHNFSQPTGTSNGIQSNLVYGSGLYVGMITDNTANSYPIALYSSDGVTWNTSTVAGAQVGGRAVSLATNGTQFYGFDASYSAYHYSSVNGTSWTSTSGYIGGNSYGSTWDAERGFMTQQASPPTIYVNNRPNDATDWSAVTTITTPLGGYSIVAFPRTVTPTILIQNAWGATANSSISYDGGYTFTTTILPQNAAFNNNNATVFKNKIYILTTYPTLAAIIGSPY
jgi:hypothetical protein